MNPLFRRLTWALMLTGVLVPLTVLATPAPVHADTCTPIATLPADLPPSGPLDTGANVIATINHARQQEGCTVSLSIDPTAYDAAPSEQQTLMLVGQFDWIGVGIMSVQDNADGSGRIYFSLDFLDDANATTYTPPATADTQPPTMDPPTIVDANTVQVTNVQDDGDGTQAAAVTGVVFSVDSAVDQNGKFLTVVATQRDPATPGTWTATLAATDLTTLHAVAVDGSGNYTDCGGNATSCSPTHRNS